MKLTIDPKLFAELVTWAARSLPQRPVVPVLSGLLLEADADQLTVSAFDYDLSVRGHTTADIAEPGRILLPGRVLAEVAKSLPTISFVELAANDREATLTCGRSEFALPTMPADDFPTLPEPPAAVGTIDGSSLAVAVQQIAVACSRDDSVPMLFGIRVDANGDQLTLAATDRYRIAVRDLAWQPNGDQTLGQLIPGRTLHDIAKTLHGEVTISLNNQLAAFSCADRITTARLIAEPFIDYRARVTLDATTTATINADHLASAVKRVALVADRDNASIRLSFTSDQVVVRAGDASIGRGSEVVECGLDGDDIEIAFQSQFLLDSLAGIDGQARIGMQTPTQPALFSSTDSSYTHLVMSLRLS